MFAYIESNFLGRPLRRLLGTKGAKEIPTKLSIDTITPVVDVAQGGFSRAVYYLRNPDNFNNCIATFTGGTTKNINLIGEDTIFALQNIPNAIDEEPKDTRIFQLFFNVVFPTFIVGGPRLGVRYFLEEKSSNAVQVIHDQTYVYSTDGASGRTYPFSLFGISYLSDRLAPQTTLPMNTGCWNGIVPSTHRFKAQFFIESGVFVANTRIDTHLIAAQVPVGCRLPK